MGAELAIVLLRRFVEAACQVLCLPSLIRLKLRLIFWFSVLLDLHGQIRVERLALEFFAVEEWLTVKVGFAVLKKGKLVFLLFEG